MPEGESGVSVASPGSLVSPTPSKEALLLRVLSGGLTKQAEATFLPLPVQAHTPKTPESSATGEAKKPELADPR